MKNYSVLKHSLRTGSLSSLECFNTRIPKSVFENLGDSYTGYYACLARRSKEFDSLILHQIVAR